MGQVTSSRCFRACQAQYTRKADFIHTYIFPRGMTLSQRAFRGLAEAGGLGWCDQVDFAQDHAQTLRLGRFHLIYCEAGFLGGGITISQVTRVKPA
ncbi:hypothetical protein AQZ52_11730 [Novosphingobium fuchskuhlense]|uniref:Uncharacterized protein n=2 Tax=Novosphingobium fuchskuhlense TaxID=1117702 RepID=A0A117UUX2_9SPHN|nr:hypothetical protein AQZ52_11730 [Novosphingobium fuchskuhlense]